MHFRSSLKNPSCILLVGFIYQTYALPQNAGPVTALPTTSSQVSLSVRPSTIVAAPAPASSNVTTFTFGPADFADGPVETISRTVNLLTLPGRNSTSDSPSTNGAIDSLRRRDTPTTVTAVAYNFGSFTGVDGNELYTIAANASERESIISFVRLAATAAAHHGSDHGDMDNTFFNFTRGNYMLWARSYAPWSTGSRPFVWSDVQVITDTCLFGLNNVSLPVNYFAGVVNDESGTPHVNWAITPIFSFGSEDPYALSADNDVSNLAGGPQRSLLAQITLEGTGLTVVIQTGILTAIGYFMNTSARFALNQWAGCPSEYQTEAFTLQGSMLYNVPFDFLPTGQATFSHQEIALLLGALVKYTKGSRYTTAEELPVLRGYLLQGGVELATFVLGASVRDEFAPRQGLMQRLGYGAFALNNYP